MKFLHTADLHIGKRIFELSLMEDQAYILRQIVEIALEERVDALLIAGDVYDRAVPPAEGVTLLDDFLTKLLKQHIPVIMITGNHDSPERVAFADRILEKQGLYIAGEVDKEPKTVTLTDAFGEVDFVCLPFVKPAQAGCASNAQAVEKLLSSLSVDKKENRRRVLVTHYFVVGEMGESPLLSQSESDVNVGGLDAVPASLFQDFDYAALGHIHKAQKVGSGNVYYSGSALKYSFGEALGEKSVNIVELEEKGRVSVKMRALKPLHEMRCIRGELGELVKAETVLSQGDGLADYLQVTLTDREELIDPMASLRSVYPNVLQILFQKNLKREDAPYESRIEVGKKSTQELFSDFYEMLKGEPLDEKRKTIVEEAARAAQKAEGYPTCAADC